MRGGSLLVGADMGDTHETEAYHGDVYFGFGGGRVHKGFKSN
jgi:hypothetical protein